MGVRGLLTYCLSHQAQCVELVNLVDIARDRGGIEILVDFYSIDHYIIAKLSRSLNIVSGNPLIHLQGGEYRTVDEFVRKLYTDLKALGITLVIVTDGAKGSSKVMTEQKLDTWRSRYGQNMGRLGRVVEVVCGRQDASTLDQDDTVRPVLMELQLLASLRSCGAEVIQCPSGEADYVLAKNLLQRPKAFAIYSNDSDFCIFKDCAFFPNKLFDLEDDLYLGKDELMPRTPTDRLMVGIIRARRVAQALGMADHAAMVELSLVAGNDFTGPHLGGRLRGKFNLRTNRVEDVAAWIKRYRTVENHPVLQREMERHREFARRVAHSRRFYSLHPGIDDDGHGKPALTRFIEDQIRQGLYPSIVLSMHLRFYWHRTILEDLKVGEPNAEVALCDLRSHFYNMILGSNDHSVVEHGRDQDQDLVSSEVEMSEMRGLPKVTAVKPKDVSRNLQTFVRILTHYEPQFQPHYIEAFGDKTGFVLYLLRYFLNITVGHSLHIREAEFDALFTTTLCSVDVGRYQKMAVRCNIRCLTVGNWFQALYRQVYKILAPLLHLQPLLPEPCAVFSGALWTAFYMVNTQQEGLLTQGFPTSQFREVMKDKDTVMETHREALVAVKQGFFV